MASDERREKWEGRRVVILGLARQGMALAHYLAEQGAQVVVSDLKRPEELQAEMATLKDLSVEFVLGEHPPELLRHADLLCLSGGVPTTIPLVEQARRQGVGLSNDSQIFLEACPARSVGITGSAGKTTTTALVWEMAQAHLENSSGRAWVGGNIGNPLIADLGRMEPDDLVVIELSSFQLEVMTVSTPVAAILNITPNHLDRHHSMQAYTEAKSRILDFQSPEDVAVLGVDDEGAWGLRHRVRGRLVGFGEKLPAGREGSFLREGKIWLRQGGAEVAICDREDVALRGEHNLMNVTAACAIAAAAGIRPEAMAAGVRRFQGLAHRLEFVRRFKGADWYNDSIATAPERAIAAIRSFEEPLVLLAGGRDKDLPWQEFAELVCGRVDHLILFGEAAEKIHAAVDGAACSKRPESIEVLPGLEAAVKAAAEAAREGDVVLLAPGGTSFDEFKDFAARGDRFKAWVAAL